MKSHDVSLVRRKVVVVMTCFNRRETTLECLRALEDGTGLDGIDTSVVLVDDGSTDGTAEAVHVRFPQVQVIRHEGPPLFWCRGMHHALEAAMARGPDALLWLNDDTRLHADALARLLACADERRAATGRPSLIVGSTLDNSGQRHTYGGERRASRVRRTSFRLVPPEPRPQAVDTFNGNVVLVPRDAYEIVGNLDPAFEHAMGDIDFGLRARALGVDLWLAPGFHGWCSHNPVCGTFSDSELDWRSRWRHLLSRKGLPWRSWLHFTRRHAGVAWPIFFIWPYARLGVSHLLGRLLNRHQRPG